MSWQTRTLGEICDEVGGIIRTGPFGSQLHESDYLSEGLPVVMPKDILDGKVSTESIARIGEKDEQRLSQHKLQTGDIVYGRRGDIGRRALITERESGWLCGTGCLRISLGNKVLSPSFLFYYLGQPEIIGWIANQAIGATLPNLNTSIIRRIPVSYPPLQIQEYIASILSAYDDLIENNTQRIKLLEQAARDLYREWFVEFRSPGHEQSELQDSELGPIPAGWEVKPLVAICDLVMGQSPKSEYYNQIGEGLPFHQGVTNFGDRFPTHKVYCTVENRIANPGDILFSVRAPVGRMNLANTKLAIGRGLSAIRSKHGHQAFLFEQLKDRFQEEDTMGSGTIFQSVTKDDMLKIDLLEPPIGITERFEQVVQPINESIGVLINKNSILRETRDLLLPRLISGELSVEELDIEVQA